MNNLHNRKYTVKFIITGLKSILKLVKLQSFVVKCPNGCKYCLFLYYARKIDTFLYRGINFLDVIPKCTKFATLQAYIFWYFTTFRRRTLQLY